MALLLDTNVVSELRKAQPHQKVLAWQQREIRSIAYISTLVIGEIRQGIERVRPRDPQQAKALDRWLAGLIHIYDERILPVSVEVAQQWGRLNVPPQPPPIVDGLMAATALVHGLTLVTRNVRDVTGTGVTVVNPFA